MAALHEGDAVAQGVRGEIQSEAVGGELVGQHVAGVAGIGADLEEGSHRADKIEMLEDDGAAAHVLIEIGGDGALGLAERGEVVELDFRALHRERLGVEGGRHSFDSNNGRRWEPGT